MTVLRRSTFVPYKAPLTEANLPDQAGKVFIITGGSSGVGKELARILYQHNAKIYLAARNEAQVKEAIADIQATQPSSKGTLIFLKLDLADLSTMKASAAEFLSQETRLDVLWNNAGVMTPPQGSKTAQGYELQLGVNTLGHFLFVHFLTPVLKQTAAMKETKKGAVRVVWVSSMSTDFAPTPVIDFENMDYRRDEDAMMKYNRSKAGNLIHAAEFARRFHDSGVLSLSMNPGLLATNLQRNFGTAQMLYVVGPSPLFTISANLQKLMARPAKFGAYTELFAGLDPSITAQDRWVTPFGRREEPRKDLVEAELGGKYWEWSEAQVRPYL